MFDGQFAAVGGETAVIPCDLFPYDSSCQPRVRVPLGLEDAAVELNAACARDNARAGLQDAGLNDGSSSVAVVVAVAAARSGEHQSARAGLDQTAAGAAGQLAGEGGKVTGGVGIVVDVDRPFGRR